MSIPIPQMLGLATGAVDLIQKVLSRGPQQGNFEQMLGATIDGKSASGKGGLNALLAGLKSGDADAVNDLLASHAGSFLAQLLGGLQSLGLEGADIRALLGGKAGALSDGGLKKLLAGAGMNADDIAALMGDAELKGNIKDLLGGKLQNLVQQSLSPEDARTFLTQAQQDNEAMAALLKVSEGTGGKAEAFRQQLQHLVTGSLTEADPSLAVVVQDGRLGLVKRAGAAGRGDAKGGVQNAVDILTKEMGVSDETLQKLFFSSDEGERRDALADLKKTLNAYYKKHQGKDVPEGSDEALGLVRQSLSKNEWAGLEDGLKLWRPNLAVTDLQMGRQGFESLVTRFSADPSASMEKHLQQVMDQVRKGLPGEIKNGEGNMTLRLDPPILGRVDVDVSLRDGKLQAVFRTEQGVTRELLQQNMHLLRESLAEQGIRVANVSVNTGLSEQRSQQEAFAALADSGRGGSHRGGAEGEGWNGHGSGDDEDLGMHAGQVYRRAMGAGGLDVFA